MPGFGRAVFDLLAQLGDVVVDRARQRKLVVAPDFIEQLVAGYGFALVLYEVFENFKFAR